MWSSVVFTAVTINNILWFVTVINLSMLENKNILVELFDTALNADFCTFEPFQIHCLSFTFSWALTSLCLISSFLSSMDLH